jgi:hypothetical protein
MTMRKGHYLFFSKSNLLVIFCIALAGIAGRQVYGIIDHKVSESNSIESHKVKFSSNNHGSSNLSIVINHLPKKLSETSGLIYYSGGLWTHNDSRGLPQIYKFDTVTGQIKQTITIENAVNVDWEDITQDSRFIYIGDFGNNFGNRRDLSIYRIKKSQIPAFGDATLMPELIFFKYSDQSDFSSAFNNNNYDCEAMLSSGDSLYLFSKRWRDHKSMMYVLPKNPGIWVAQKRDSLDAHALITGAAISNTFKEVALIGYNKSSPVIWFLYDYRGSGFIKGLKQRIKFPRQTGAQTEGITYTHGRNLFISSEKTLICPQRLYRFNSSPWTSETISDYYKTGQDYESDVLLKTQDFSSKLEHISFKSFPKTYL